MVAVVTFSVKDVVCDSEPDTAVTLTEYVVAARFKGVVIVIVELQFGVHDDGENEAVAPDGKTEAERDTAWAVPESVASVMDSVTDCPAVTDRLPPFEMEKSKLGVGGGGDEVVVPLEEFL